MFGFLYTIISSISPLILDLIALFNKKIKIFLSERNAGQEVTISKKKYWIHCASLGEFEMAIPLIEALLKNHSLDDLLVTFFSPSGYKQAIKGDYKQCIMYLPLDTRKDVKQFYDHYNPTNALLIRYDFWFNFISQGLERDTRFYLVNGRFTKNHQIFGFIGNPYLRLMKQFENIFVSDNNSYKVLVANNIKNLLMTGDTRFDRVSQLKKSNKSFPDIELFKGDRKLLILGSSWKAEEEVLAVLLKQNFSNLAVIIAPHNINRAEDIKNNFSGYGAKLYTEDDFSTSDNILIINTIGMLSSLYRYGDFALVGGGFSGALHNILEPAVWGCHISFGPKIDKFPEASDFIEAGFAYKIENTDTWINEVSLLIKEESKLKSMAKRANDFVQQQKGATDRIWKSINS